MTTTYISDAEFLAYIKSSATIDALMQLCMSTASREVDAYCGRQFDKVSSGETRYYSNFGCPGSSKALYLIDVDDIAEATGFALHTDNGAGTYSTAWTIDTDVILEPLNRVRAGIPGWPFTQLHAVGSRTFPVMTSPLQRPNIRVAAHYGWAAVPDPVKQATKIMAGQLYKLSDALLGVAGWGAYGDIKVRDIPQAKILLDPLRNARTSYGIA